MDPLGTAYLRDLTGRLPPGTSASDYHAWFESLADTFGSGVASGLTPLTRERLVATRGERDPSAQAVLEWLFDDWLRFARGLAGSRSVHGLAAGDDLFDVLVTADTLYALRIGRRPRKAAAGSPRRAPSLFDWTSPEAAADEDWREQVRARVRYSVASEREYLELDPKSFAMPLVVLEARLVATEEVDALVELKGPVRTSSTRRADIKTVVLTATDHPMSGLKSLLRAAGVAI